MGTEQDQGSSTASPTKQRPISPNDLQNVGTVESDVEVSLYRHDREQSADRSSLSKHRRSQSLDDVRIDDTTADTVVTGSDKIYEDDASVNGHGDNDENFTAGSKETEVGPGNSGGTDDEEQSAGKSDSGSQSVRIIPVVRAESFKEAMRSSRLDVQPPEYSRTVSQPAPATSRDSRSSWMMPLLEEAFNEMFTSASGRPSSLISSSGTSHDRTQSEASTSSTLVEEHGVQMRRTSGSASGQTSPLNMPEFHNKRRSRLFDWEPTLLGPISGSSDNLASSTDDGGTNSSTGFSAESRLPTGFETGLLDFGFRPSLLSRMSQPWTDSHFLKSFFNSDTLSLFGNVSLDSDKVAKTSGEPRQSTSRVIPVKVVASRSASDGETVKASRSGPGGRGSKITGDRRSAESKTSNVAEDECDSAPVSEQKSVSPSKHSSQPTQPDTHLPAGFLTGFGDTSIPNISDAEITRCAKFGGRSDVDSRKVKTENESSVRVIPVTHEQNLASSKATTKREAGSRGLVIPVVVHSSASTRENIASDDARSSTNLTTFQKSSTGPVKIPVTIMQSDGGTASNVSTAENASQIDRQPVSDRNYPPLCYDDEDEVKKILQEMTIKRLPIRDTVRLLNRNVKTSRSMEFPDSKWHAICQESPSSNTSVDSPTVDLLPPGFWVGNSSASKPHDSFAPGIQTSSVTGNLIRRRLNQFGRGDAES